MTAADIDPITATFIRNDWGDRRLNLEFVTSHPETHPIVAEADGAVVGTGVLSVHGPVGWIGTIFVEPAWRRRGVGMAITRATIETAEAAGCRTLVLVATEAGRPMYERLGFEVQTVLPGPRRAGPAGDRRDRPPGACLPSGRPCGDHGPGRCRHRRGPRPPAARLRRARHDPRARRRRRQSRRLRRAGPLGRRRDDRARSRTTPWRSCARVASRRDRITRVRAGVLAENEAGLALMLADGWTESWHAPRLVRGDPLRWQPDAIWGQFNHAFG